MLYIRTDMNASIGMGHLMRCLAVADAARSMGEETTFLLADSHASGLLSAKKYPYIVLGSQWDNLEAELLALRGIILRYGIKRLLVDSYQVTEAYFRELKKDAEVYYMDDLNAFRYDVDAIISYEIYSKLSHYEACAKQSRMYLGTEYVPLKKEFSHCGEKLVAEKASRVLLLSGGTDPYHFLSRLLERIDRKEYEAIDVICGAYNTDYPVLCGAYQKEKNVYIHQAVSDMDVYMKNADMAVSAGGLTIYELCACGTPAVSYSFADNQLGTVQKFASDSIIDYAGDVRTVDAASNAAACLEKYRLDQALRKERSQKMQRLIDGKGAGRIAQALMA